MLRRALIGLQSGFTLRSQPPLAASFKLTWHRKTGLQRRPFFSGRAAVVYLYTLCPPILKFKTQIAPDFVFPFGEPGAQDRHLVGWQGTWVFFRAGVAFNVSLERGAFYIAWRFHIDEHFKAGLTRPDPSVNYQHYVHGSCFFGLA